MSSYAKLSLGSLELGTTRNEIDPGLMWIYRPSDKRIERIDRRQRRRLARYVEEDFIDEFDESNPFTIVEYSCTVAVARDRMDLKGFTYEVAEETFKRELDAEIQRYEGYLRDGRFTQVSRAYEEKLALLRSLSIEDWREALARIRDEQLTRGTVGEMPIDDPQLPLLRHMLEDASEFYGFPGDDHRHVVRIALECASPEERLTYDLSDLVTGGWESASEDEIDHIVAAAEGYFDEDFLLHQRVIVLTEGDYDRRTLERSLNLLYPHLAEYFHFFDFTGRRVGGGVGELANLVRAFAAADVRHRILALFDNDTAAKAALSNLDLDSLPGNIAVRHYPSLPLAEDYPTLGPSGKARMDVNGLAGSIEIYLGQDVLRDDDGVISPVQWTGYDRKMGAYQGEILDKQKVHDRFAEKLACCETDPEQINCYDWEGIRAILDKMRTAFHRTDAQAILSTAVNE